jgi:hypothetical protein
MCEGRGPAGRRYWKTADFGGLGLNIYKWNPPGPDGEGDEAQGRFFIGRSGTWYELVAKSPSRFPHSLHYAYEVTEESKRRQAKDEGSLARYEEETADTVKVET